ncbi:Nuclear transport factor 2 family protein [Prunus dulcis]|uniref:Nuclear transport factor 2 family protein n=1 Tax=Prunus dulcis TaxID=3755 RepID=A0A4Y1RWR0_PRUDU|nr:Nuclear transport factor 2 family protein [Prunus dulcis]
MLGACLTPNKSFNLNTLFSVFPQALNATSHIRNQKTQLSLSGKKLQQKLISNIVGKNCKYEKWRVFGSDDGSCGIAPLPLPPSVLEAVQDFYKAINAKDIQALEQLLADDCHYQDLVFYVPFVGKEAIVHFLTKVMDAMGSNIHFVLDAGTEGGNLTASSGKTKKYPLPLVAHSLNMNKLNESSFLGKQLAWKNFHSNQKLLKSASTFFDLYPMAAEALLLKSHGSGPHEGLDTLLDKLLGRHRT